MFPPPDLPQLWLEQLLLLPRGSRAGWGAGLREPSPAAPARWAPPSLSSWWDDTHTAPAGGLWERGETDSDGKWQVTSNDMIISVPFPAPGETSYSLEGREWGGCPVAVADAGRSLAESTVVSDSTPLQWIRLPCCAGICHVSAPATYPALWPERS